MDFESFASKQKSIDYINKNSADGYNNVRPHKFTKLVNREIWVKAKYGYHCLSCHPYVQEYTMYLHCSLYSSWKMNLNIRVKVRDDRPKC